MIVAVAASIVVAAVVAVVVAVFVVDGGGVWLQLYQWCVVTSGVGLRYGATPRSA